MVGLDDPGDIEECDSNTNTRTCGPLGACMVGPVGAQEDVHVQRCVYDRIFIERLCPNSLCCEEDLCNSFDNFTEFQASQTNTDQSSSNVDASSASSLISMTSIFVTASSVGRLIFSFCVCWNVLL